MEYFRRGGPAPCFYHSCHVVCAVAASGSATREEHLDPQGSPRGQQEVGGLTWLCMHSHPSLAHQKGL